MPQSPVKMMLDAAFRKQHSASDTDIAALHDVAEAAAAWWKARRPSGWSLEQHLADPAVNCEGAREHQLAQAVASWLRVKR
jgi:hypothetical protein